MEPTGVSPPGVAPAAVLSRCHCCGVERKTKPTPKGQARTPKGWKLHAGQTWCGACWGKSYVLRAAALPVAGPADEGTWPELRVALRAAWSESTALANWLATELYARDVRREPGGPAKMPPAPKTYLYPEARTRFPEVPSQQVAAAEQAAKGKYGAKRYEVVWTGEASVANHRYPTPYTLPNQAWTAEVREGVPMVSLRLGGRRWTLRLRGGPQMRRQVAMVRLLAGGEAVAGELAVYRKRASTSDHRPGIPEGGVAWDVVVKLVGWFPRREAREREGTLAVRTAGDSFMVAANAKDEAVWSLHGDQVKRWVAEHRRRLQRWADDAKAEQRPVPSFARRREEATALHRRRMDSFISEASAQMANYADRRGFAEVRLDDKDRTFAGGFPWDRFLTALAYKLEDRGIMLTIASGKVTSETRPPLETE